MVVVVAEEDELVSSMQFFAGSEHFSVAEGGTRLLVGGVGEVMRKSDK